MNRFTLYTNSEKDSIDFISICQKKLISNKSEVIILQENIDFNVEDLEIDSLPSLKFSFINSSNQTEYEQLFKNLNESMSYLKNQHLI